MRVIAFFLFALAALAAYVAYAIYTTVDYTTLSGLTPDARLVVQMAFNIAALSALLLPALGTVALNDDRRLRRLYPSRYRKAL